MKLAFIGAGKMATAIAGGLVEASVVPIDQMAATDILESARAGFTAATGVACEADATAVLSGADIVVIAVKPQTLAAAIEPLSGHLTGKLVISIAAGVPLQTLTGLIPSRRIVRVMPNTPLTISRGASVYCCTDAVTGHDREMVRMIFGALGIVYEMSEDKLDAVTALSGSGPAYVFELIDSLVAGAVKMDLDRDAALELTVQTVAGAAEMLHRGLGTPEELRNAVTSPGGTTAAGLEVLRRGHFRDLIQDVLLAAKTRSEELGRSQS